jgi:caa(3)-type oxidase subunit IV
MGGAHADVSKHVKAYIGVFLALAVFTGVTVGVSYVHFGSHMMNIAVALVIAIIKASLVAAIFMHLKWERGLTIWISLVFCAVFFVALMLLPILTASDLPPKARDGRAPAGKVQYGSWDVRPMEKSGSAAGGH